MQALRALDGTRASLADADAHRTEGITCTRPLKLVRRRRHQARTAHAQRMAERDRERMTMTHKANRRLSRRFALVCLNRYPELDKE